MSPNDFVESCLRLQTHADCIPHSYHMYTKCFSIVICCEGAYESTLTLLPLCRWGWISRENGGRAEAEQWSWLRIQTHTVCIPHPYYMYTKYFSTLLSCRWAKGPALTLLLMCQVGLDLRKIRVWPEWCCGIMLEAPNPFGVHPTSISYVDKVLQHLDMLWIGIWVHPYTVTLVQAESGF
jgi:hypothetical protein